MLAVEGDTFKTLGEHIRMQQMSNHAGNTNAYHRISHESNDVMTTWICLCFHRKFCRPLSRSFAQRQHTHKTQEETKEHEGTKSHHNATTVLYARNPTSLSLNSFLSQFSPQTFRRTCLILWLLCVTVYLLADASICFNPLWSFMFFHWVENDLNDLVGSTRCTPCTIWRCTPDVARCARDHCMELQAAVKMNPGSCYIWSRENVESHINKICRSNDMAHATNNFAKSCNPTADTPDTHRLTTTASLSDASMGQWPIRQFF